MSFRTFIITAVLGTTAAARAQAPTTPAVEATRLRQCAAYAEKHVADSAQTVGKEAEALFRKRVEANGRDVEALVGLARTLSQCLVPAAGFIAQGELSSNAMDLLDQAIALQPDHWMARFVLASIAYRSPSFLGRGTRAAQEFDYLLRLQGQRTDNPMYARVYELRGMQLNRGGHGDSALALWMRGAALFPTDSALNALAHRVARPSTQSPPSTGPSSTATLETVKVVASAAPPPPALPSVREVPRGQMLMTAGGAADVFLGVQAQPGVTRVGEGSDVYTRGGDPVETALLVNGARFNSLSRFETLNGGMFGALEPFVVKSVRYSSGGYSARYGNALSGVIDIETDGRPRERAMRTGASLVQIAGTARGPFNTKMGGWMNGRVSNTRALLATHGRTNEFVGAPHSEEIIASLIANPSPTGEVRATAIVERDDARRNIRAAGWSGPFHSAGETRALMLSTRWLAASAPVNVRGSVAASGRSTSWRYGVLSRDRDERSAQSRVDVDWQPAPAVTIRGGLEHGAFTRNETGSVPTTPSVAPGSPLRTLGGAADANLVGAYGETEIGRGAATLTLGLRGDRLPGESDATIDPRMALSWRAGDWTARMSAGVFHQGRWRPDAAIPNAGLPGSIPTKANHVVAGVERNTFAAAFRAEGYVKDYSRFASFGSGPQVREGRARGLDVLAQRHDVGRLSGWLGYSLMDASVLLADGSRARSSFDVTHSSTGSLTAKVARDWSVGYTVRYGSGVPLTPIVGSTQSGGSAMPVYGALMSERLPVYARMDARLMRFVRAPSLLLTTFVELINVANRRNVSGVTWDASYTVRQPMYAFFANRTLVVGAEVQFR